MSDQPARPRYLTTAEMAKVVRTVLKAAFPGQKFFVRSDNYAGGSSINVSYSSTELFSSDVEGKVKGLQGATFDGMTDMKSYRDVTLPSGEVVSGGADFIFVDNTEREWERAQWQSRRDAQLSA